MKISSSNTYDTTAAAFIISTDADANQDADDMLDGDFSTAYTSAGTDATFRVLRTYSAPNAIQLEYVALAGHNFGDIGGSLEIDVNFGAELQTIVFDVCSPTNTVMVTFDQLTVTAIDITFTKTSSTDKVTITYIAAGEELDLSSSQNNEQGGYPRLWRTANKKIRSTNNGLAQPVAYVRESFSRPATLSIPNVLVSDMDTSNWEGLLNLIYNRGDFFIKEDDGDTTGIADNPRSSYLCMNADMLPPKTNASTRQLNNMSIKFNAVTGR